jgi:hypothetical protein
MTMSYLTLDAGLVVTHTLWVASFSDVKRGAHARPV